tara:strand:+ start:11202 stop:11693 length:492 start_codon:yes stop_codon:yes gene_type:complete
MNTETLFIAIDPATTTGWCHRDSHGEWKLAAVKAAPTKGRGAEPSWCRPGKIFNRLLRLKYELSVRHTLPLHIVCEGAAGFTRGQKAVQVGHELRGGIKAFCWHTNISYTELQPQSLQQFHGGRSQVPKEDMLKIAQERYGYKGTSDNVADAILIYQWAIRNL